MAVLQKADFTGSFMFTATVNPGNHTAVTAVDTAITGTPNKATDLIVAIPPATLEAGIAVQCVHTIIDGGFTVRTTNPTAGAIDPASATWTFLCFRR